MLWQLLAQVRWLWDRWGVKDGKGLAQATATFLQVHRPCTVGGGQKATSNPAAHLTGSRADKTN